MTSIYSDKDYFHEIGANRHPGVFPLNRQCYNPSIDSIDGTVGLWGTQSLYEKQSFAEMINISSDDPSDIDAGVGARSLRYELIDDNFNIKVDEIKLNGTDDVQIGPAMAINGMRIIQTGASKTNVGEITAIGDNSGNTHGMMAIGTSLTQDVSYTVAGKRQLFLKRIRITCTYLGSGPSRERCEIIGTLEEASGTRTVVFDEVIHTEPFAVFDYDWPFSNGIPEKSTIIWSSNTTGPTRVSCRYFGILEYV